MVSKILDSIYIIPVLLEHFKSPDYTTRKILADYGIDNPEEYKDIQNMLEYHLKFITTKTGDYELLRQGLTEYFDKYLSEIFVKAGIVDKNLLMLDYGCGAGQYSLQFLRDNPNSYAIRVDRDLATFNHSPENLSDLQADFEKNPDWYKYYMYNMDIVLMSELLHCKVIKTQRYLVDSAMHLLKSGGLFIINENEDYPMEYRIGKLKNGYFPIVSPDNVKNLMKSLPFSLKQHFKINKHNVFVYEKF